MNKYRVMPIYQPYTYLIGWTTHNKFYYGVRFAKDCNIDDLWQEYFTSSKEVLYFRNEHGEPDVIQIRKVFESAENAIKWESKVLRRMKAHTHDKFLNQSVWPCMSPLLKRVPWNKGRKDPYSEQTKAKKSLYMKNNNPMYRSECVEKMKNSLLGHKHSKETRDKLSEMRKGSVPWNKGIPNTKAQKDKIRKATGTRVFVYGVAYDSIRQASERSGIYRPTLMKMLKDDNNREVYYA